MLLIEAPDYVTLGTLHAQILFLLTQCLLAQKLDGLVPTEIGIEHTISQINANLLGSYRCIVVILIPWRDLSLLGHLCVAIVLQKLVRFT